MLKKTLFLFVFCLAFNSIAVMAAPAKAYNLPEILQLKDNYQKEKELVAYIKLIAHFPLDSFKTAKAQVHQDFINAGYENGQAVDTYIESIYQHRLNNNAEAEIGIIRATELANKDDHYLLYVFFSNLAFIQADDGNAIGAISSYREAKKQAILLNDAYFEVLININVSDIYYKYNFYSQSLQSLTESQTIISDRKVSQPRIKNIIFNNKCENFFRLGNLDSLKAYNQILKQSKDNSHNLYTYIKRTNYYILLLNHDYKGTIQQITLLKKDTLYKYSDIIDSQNLADAWFNEGNLDSSKYVLQGLLANKALNLNNHPEIEYHLYELLGKIAEKQHDIGQAAINFKMALQDARENVTRMISVGDISSGMKQDEMKYLYAQQEEAAQNQSLWLRLLVVVAVLIIAVIGMFYRNTKQKRHYEKLLFEAKKEELAYINSHDIRRHLTNILGIIDIVQHAENKEKEYLQAEDYLFRSAEELDRAIKNIAEKLDN